VAYTSSIQTAKWVLSTLGKNRGFTEKTQVEHSTKDDKPIFIIAKEEDKY